MTQPLPISQQLPFDVRTALVNASKIKNPVQRMAAIEQIQAMAKARFPHLFQRI